MAVERLEEKKELHYLYGDSSADFMLFVSVTLLSLPQASE